VSQPVYVLFILAIYSVCDFDDCLISIMNSHSYWLRRGHSQEANPGPQSPGIFFHIFLGFSYIHHRANKYSR